METPQSILHYLGSQSTIPECSGPKYVEFMTLEFGLKSLPAVIFFFTGGYRYFNIKHTARSQVRYTKNFKAKVAISSLIAIASVAYIPLIMSQPGDSKHLSLIN
jgi:hypothetical protein